MFFISFPFCCCHSPGPDYFPTPNRAPAVHVASTVSIMAVLHRRETALGILRRRHIAELHIGFALRVSVPGWFWASSLVRLCIHGVSNIRHPTWQSIREASDFEGIKDNCRWSCAAIAQRIHKQWRDDRSRRNDAGNPDTKLARAQDCLLSTINSQPQLL